jgi:glycosyltransferase involved in cell wall biosynthesis
MDISVVIPLYNEEKNIHELHRQLHKILQSLKKDYEIIFIDDGSTDNSYRELEKLTDSHIHIIKFRKNFGQSAAWDAGFQYAQGKLVITMDADLQNDPADIPRLLEKLNEGYDIVSGWRHSRKDSISKRLFSSFSRYLRKLIIDDRIHDSGCSLKVYKKECIQDLGLQGEMHRYITEILALKGYKIGEVRVNHRPRRSGKTKYNLLRVPKGFLDLLVIAFWQKYSARPIHLFGSAGILMSMAGFLTGFYLIYEKFIHRQPIGDRPLVMLAVLLVVLGIQFIIFGLISDILIKTYYSGTRKYYSIEKIK